ncbi:MAG: DUF4255 domain-containing protein [Bryobacteraceae bacterium]
MADFGVIADVSATLQTVLTDAVSPLAPPPNEPFAEVHDLQGVIQTAPPRLTLFLFEVLEDMSARNRPRTYTEIPPDVGIRRPTMALLLRYLVTPWSGDRLTDHRLLGRAMQALYDDAILSGTQLLGGLAGRNDALKVTIEPLTLEERTRIWHAVQQPYRLSVIYNVRVVHVDSQQEQQLQPVTRRSLDYAKPEGV